MASEIHWLFQTNETFKICIVTKMQSTSNTAIQQEYKQCQKLLLNIRSLLEQVEIGKTFFLANLLKKKLEKK